MRETTSAITRVALLVVMTGMFAAVWSNDQQTQTEFIIARREAAHAATQLAHVEPTLSQPTIKDALASTLKAQDVSVVTQVTIEMTLPVDITPGRFRVVQPSGPMFTINVSATGDIKATPRDIYVLEVAEGGRTCFIRIDQPDTIQATASREVSALK